MLVSVRTVVVKFRTLASKVSDDESIPGSFFSVISALMHETFTCIDKKYLGFNKRL